MDIITLPNGRQAISFVPEDSKDLGIVHISTIKRLAALLPKANPKEIVGELIDRLSGMRDPSSCLAEAIAECNEFTAFHETVNLIREYKPEPAVCQPQENIIQNYH